MAMMTRMLLIWILGAVVVVCGNSVVAESADLCRLPSMLTLASDGTSAYEVVVPAGAPESVRIAADEFIRLVALSTGAVLPQATMPTAGKPHVFIGDTAAAAAVGIDMEGIGHDAFVIRAVGGDLYLVGNDEAAPFDRMFPSSTSVGSYNAVIEFARRFMGVRWYMPGPMGQEIPRHDVLTVPADLNLHIAPRFPVRSMDLGRKISQSIRDSGRYKGDYFVPELPEANFAWARRLRLGCAYHVERQHAWYLWVPGRNHKSWALQDYGQTHPEYFALVDGVRQTQGTGHGGQLCVSNPEVARVYADNVVAYANRTGRTEISLSCNDGGGHCQCDACRAMDVETDSHGKPVLSERMMIFANRVAELALAQRPDLKFGMYAYHDNRHPPLHTRAHPAITISDVYNHVPYRYWNLQERAAMERDMRKWRQENDHVILTSYYTDGHWSLPWSTFEQYTWMVKTCADYPSSDGFYMNFIGNSLVAPVGSLGPDPWIFSQLMWDPSQEPNALKQEWYSGALGDDIGSRIEDYFDTITQSMAQQCLEQKYTYTGSAADAKGLPFTAYRAIRDRCEHLIQQALTLAADRPARYRWRVDQIARGWRYAALTIDAMDAYARAVEAEVPPDSPLWQQAASFGLRRQEFVNDANNWYAISPYVVEYHDRAVPLPLITEVPGKDATLRVPKLDGSSVVIDGKLDEQQWKRSARTLKAGDNRTGNPAAVDMVGYLFYDMTCLYMAFECAEPQMEQIHSVNETDAIWSGEVVEFFISRGAQGHCWQLCVNPDGFGVSHALRGEHGRDVRWKPDSWTYAASQADDRWFVEMKINWSDIEMTGPPAAGTMWRGNFCRERQLSGSTELISWSPTLSSFAIVPKMGVFLFK